MRELVNHKLEVDFLSILINNPDARFRSRLNLRSDMFDDPKNRRVFNFINNQHEKGDFIIVPSTYSADSTEQEFIKKIADAKIPDAAYQKIGESLNDLCMLRHLRNIGNNIAYEVLNTDADPEALLARHGAGLTNLQLGSVLEDIEDSNDFASDFMVSLEEKHRLFLENKEVAVTGAITGCSLDRCFESGFEAGDLIIVAATTSTGKSAFAIQTAIENLSLGSSVAIVSAEMSKSQVIARIISNMTGITHRKIKSGRFLSNEELSLIRRAVDSLKHWGLYIDDKQSSVLSQIMAKCRRVKFVDRNIKLIVIDYLQIISNDLVTGTKNEMIGDISRRLKQLSKDIDTPIMLVSQVNRAVDNRDGDAGPMLFDLRDSGEVENNADFVIFLHAKQAERKNTITRTEIRLAKQRNGPLGYVIADFNKDKQRFSEVESHIDF